VALVAGEESDQALDGQLIAGDDIDADIAGAPDQVMHHRAMQDLEPARARRFADDDLRDVLGMRVSDHVVGDVALAGRNGDGLAAKRLGEAQRIGDAASCALRSGLTAVQISGRKCVDPSPAISGRDRAYSAPRADRTRSTGNCGPPSVFHRAP